MDDLIDLMVSNESPSEVSDKIKELLMQKAASKVDEMRPHVAASMFDNTEPTQEDEVESDEDIEDSVEESEEE